MAVAFLKDGSWVGGVGGFFFGGLCKLQVGLSRWGFAFGWSRLLAGKL